MAKNLKLRGRATTYTPEVAREILELLAAGQSLLEICRADGKPAESTVRGWVIDDRDGFSAKYARARDIGLDHEADEIKAIADTPVEGVKTVDDGEKTIITTGDMIEHRRLQIDARKWRLSKMAPKRYGDKLTQEISGPGGGAIETTHRIVFGAVGQSAGVIEQPKQIEDGE